MPNKKATRTQIQFPPLLNLANDRPHIDTGLRNFEKQNGPYINDMIMPMYVKQLDGEYVHDYIGNNYKLNEDLYLERNGEPLFPVIDQHFERKEVTDIFQKYLSYDIDEDYDGGEPTAFLVLNDDNSLTFTYKDQVITTTPLFVEATIITTRTRIINNNALFVVYYDEADTGKVLYYRLDGTTAITRTMTAQWKRQRCRYNVNTKYSDVLVNQTISKDADPFITMCALPASRGTTGFGISLVSDYAFVRNTYSTGFITFVDVNGTFYDYGTNLQPQSTSQVAEVTTTHSCYFTTAIDRKSIPAQGSFLYKDGTYYNYDTEGVVGEELAFPSTYQPEPAQRDYITIGDVTYDYGNWTGTEATTTVTVICNPIVPFTVDIEFPDGTIQTATQEHGQAVSTYTRVYYRGEEVLTRARNATIHWDDHDFEVTPGYPISAEYTTTAEQTVSWVVAPNIFLDNGKMYSLWGFNPANNTYANSGAATSTTQYTLPNGCVIVESAEFGTINKDGTYSFTPLSFVTTSSNACVVRTNSYAIGQNFWVSNVKLHNNGGDTPATEFAASTTTAQKTAARWLEYMNSNETDLRYYPGTVRVESNSLGSYYNYFVSVINDSSADAGPLEDSCTWTPGGFRCQLNNTNWRLLYNISNAGTAVINGISYTPALHQMGTLVSPWQSVDESSIVVGNDKYCIYKDKDGTYYQISVEDGAKVQAILEDRLIIVNTTGFWNCWDAKVNKRFHYATDFNDRVFKGSSERPTESSIVSGLIEYIRYTAASINHHWEVKPRDVVSSMQPLGQCLYRCDVDTIQTYDCICPETQWTQGIDIYYSDRDVTKATMSYRFTIEPYMLQSVYRKFELDATTYSLPATVTGSMYLSPNIFTEYVNGQGNHDGVREGKSNYVLAYSKTLETLQLLYYANTETLLQDAFFVLQGQFYGVINDKIYALTYNGGVIQSRDAIVDIRGMQFIGNNPIIAFFWSPSLRSIFSFTGDCNLQHLYYASKWDEVLNPRNVYWYDESTQAIYVPTNRGLLVLGAKNTYMFEDWTNTTNVQISEDGVTHITDNGVTYDCRYYPAEGYTPKPLHIESSFWGQGATEVGSIDRFGITLYDPTEEHAVTEVTVGTRTITDVTVKSEEKKYKITPDMWDKWSHSVLLNYNPKYIQGQGIRLYVDTDKAIQQITAHVQDRATTQLAHANL